MGASDKESLIENEEQKEATTVDTPKSKSKEEPKPKEEEESFWGFAVKKWEAFTDSSSDPPAAKKEDKEQESKDGEKKEEQKEESFWDSALKKWDEVKETIAPSAKPAEEEDKDSWKDGKNNDDEMETFWADDEAQLCSENKNLALGNDPVFMNVMGIMSNAKVISDKRTQAVKDLVPYIDPKELLKTLRKLNSGKSLRALGLKPESMLARHLQDSAVSQKIFEFSKLPPQQRSEKFKLYQQKCQPVCVLEQMSTLDRQKKQNTKKLIGSFPLTEIAIHGEHLLVRQSLEDLSKDKKKGKSSFGFFGGKDSGGKKAGKPKKEKKSFKAKLSSWLK